MKAIVVTDQAAGTAEMKLVERPEHQDYLEPIPHGYTCHFARPNWGLPRRTDAVA